MSRVLLQQAAEAYQSGRSDQAEALARDACQSDPANEQAWLMCSGLMLHRQADQAAESLLREALSANPESAPLRANLALACSRQGRHAEAAELAEAVTRDHPEWISAWNTLAAALLEMGEIERAEDTIIRALAVHPDQPALTLLLGHARQAQDRGDEAQASYRQFDRQASQLVRQAEALTLSGRLAEAEHQYRQLVSTQPGNASAHAGLGRLLLRLGRAPEAAESLRAALRIEPEDAASQHFLDIATGQPLSRAHPDYVRALFDDYADAFESDLTDTLGYRIPEELAARLIEVGATLERVLDLGCGTGLMAAALTERYELMDGVDLSQRMLDLASDRGGYRHLIRSDVVEFLARDEQRWSAVLAADVLVYVGEIETLTRCLYPRLLPGGWFAFSIELSEDGRSRLDPQTGRFQHHPDEVDSILRAQGFNTPRWTLTTIRQELGSRIPGAIGLAQRPGD